MQHKTSVESCFEYYSLMGYDAVPSGGYITTCRRNLQPPSPGQDVNTNHNQPISPTWGLVGYPLNVEGTKMVSIWAAKGPGWSLTEPLGNENNVKCCCPSPEAGIMGEKQRRT
jgi:hypothetical protein